jgi:multicomponent Na+:H+ antiporter subunit D
VGSLISVVYVWRLVEAAYFQKAPERETPVREAPWQLLVPTWVLIGASIYFGIDTELTVGIATRAAESLMGGN